MQQTKTRLLDYRSALALVIANTIGTGVFTTSGFALADLGSPLWVLLAWMVGGIYALSGVRIYSDMAISFPHSGGEYAFLRNSLHPVFGTIAGWISLVAGFTTPIAAAALGAELYLNRVLMLHFEWPWIASLIIILLGVMHALAPQQGVRFQNNAVLLKVVVIVVFVGLGLVSISNNHPIEAFKAIPEQSFSWIKFAGSLVWITFAYSGWNAAVYVTGEVVGGGQTVTRALLTGTLIVIVLYLGVSAVILYSAPISELKGVADSGAIAAKALGGEYTERALSALIALALITSVSSMLMSGPRVYMQMANDGVFPKVLGAFQNGHPRLAIFLQTVLCLLLIWLAGIRELLEFTGVSLSFSAGLVVIGWLVLVGRRIIKATLISGLASLVFMTATLGIMLGSIAMRQESLFALIALLAWGAFAHFFSLSKIYTILKNSGGL